MSEVVSTATKGGMVLVNYWWPLITHSIAVCTCQRLFTSGFHSVSSRCDLCSLYAACFSVFFRKSL